MVKRKLIDSDNYSWNVINLRAGLLIKEALKQKKPIFAVCRGNPCSLTLLSVEPSNQKVENHWQKEFSGGITRSRNFA